MGGQNRYIQECAPICKNSSDTQCCNGVDNCNNVNLTPIVKSCLAGGHMWSDLITINKSLSIKNCESPKNQWCKTQKTSNSLITIDIHSCSDTCEPINTPEVTVTCCQNNSNCNLQSTQQSTLSCIASSRLADFTPASVRCNSEQNFCYVLFFLLNNFL